MFWRSKLLPKVMLLLLFLSASILVVHNHGSASASLSINSMIFYRAYWEQLDSSSVRLRILAFSKCSILKAPNLISLAIKSHNEMTLLKHETQSIEADCPWHWAPNCQWNSFVIDATTTLGVIENAEHLMVSSENQATVNLPLTKSPNYENGLSVCVPPLYWYSDWLKLSMFIEIWRQSGANHFYFYVQSVSSSVNLVLKEYEAQGIVTIVEWPLLPNSTEENPNESIYRFGHLLAQNDCRQRITHRFGIVVDVDEIILPINPQITLINFLDSALKAHPLAGSFTFKHARLHFPLWPRANETWDDWSWLEKATVTDKEGPSKAVFISDRSDLISTHKVRKHFGIYSQVEIDPTKARLYHFRQNWTYKESEEDYELAYFKGIRANISLGLNSTLTKVSKVLPEGLKLNPEVSSLITSCLSGWHETGCKTPFNSCYDKLITSDTWVISSNSSTFIVL